MSKRVRTVLVALAAGATVTAGLLGAAGTAQAAQPVDAARGASAAAPSDSALVLQGRQLETIQRFRDLAAGAPDRFAGVFTQGSAHVTVNLVAGKPSAAAADVAAIKGQAAAVGITVTFRDRRHSLRELTGIQNAATHDFALAAVANAPVSATIDPSTDSVRLSTTGATRALLARARARFGDAVTVGSAPALKLAYGRFDDTSPYYGGDRIGNTQAACTYGFSLTNLYGTTYGITAGHCWPVGTGVDVITQSGGTGDLGSGYAPFGTVQFRRYGSGSLDAELVGGQGYGGDIWVGSDLGNDSGVSSPVHSAQASCNGCNVYFDGSFTGKSLATVDSSGPGCMTVSGSTTCGLWLAYAANGQRICQPGDSGGPVFAYDGRGGVIAVGIIDACNPDGTVGAYTDINQILSTWTSTITTG